MLFPFERVVVLIYEFRTSLRWFFRYFDGARPVPLEKAELKADFELNPISVSMVLSSSDRTFDTSTAYKLEAIFPLCDKPRTFF